jgi:hypothetical protein
MTRVWTVSSPRLSPRLPVVKELVANAIKHAFEEGKAGAFRVSASGDEDQVTVIVDADGLSFPEPGSNDRGMSLAKRLMASVDELLLPSEAGSKRFDPQVLITPEPPMPRRAGPADSTTLFLQEKLCLSGNVPIEGRFAQR